MVRRFYWKWWNFIF